MEYLNNKTLRRKGSLKVRVMERGGEGIDRMRALKDNRNFRSPGGGRIDLRANRANKPL